MELFTFSENVGPGLPLWLPKGTIICDELEKLSNDKEREAGYVRVKTPHITKGKSFEVRGHAWAGDLKVEEVHVSIDFGVTWKKCTTNPPKNRLAWQRWKTQITLPETGYYEIWARTRCAFKGWAVCVNHSSCSVG